MKHPVQILTLMSFFNGLCFYGPVALLVRTETGISISQFFTLQMILSVSIFLFEIPSGLLSDRIGYKKTIVLSQILLLSSMILLLIANSYWLFTIQAVVQGISFSLSSGTYSAYLYGYCQGEEYTLNNSRLGRAGNLGYILSTISYSLIFGMFHIKGLVAATCLCTAVATLLSLFLPNKAIRQNQVIAEPTSIFSENRKFFHHGWIFFILTSSITISYIVINFFYAVKVEKTGLDYELLGVLILAYSAIELLAPSIIRHLRVTAYNKTLAFMLLTASVAFGGIFLLNNLFCLIPMLLLPLILSLCDCLIDEQLNEHIDHYELDNQRATIISIYNMGSNLLEIIFLGISAFLSGNEGNSAFLIAAVYIILIFCITFLHNRKKTI